MLVILILLLSTHSKMLNAFLYITIHIMKIPQIYIKEEFVGGCDIITEMALSGELDNLFEKNGIEFDKGAAEKIREANA